MFKGFKILESFFFKVSIYISFFIFVGIWTTLAVASSTSCGKLGEQLLMGTEDISLRDKRSSVQKAMRLIQDLKSINGVSPYKFDTDNFWLNLHLLIHPKSPLPSLPKDRREWLIKSAKARELGDKFPDLTIPEIVAVREYAIRSGKINAALYDLNIKKILYYKDYINVLSSALSKVKHYSGMTYRTVKIPRQYSMNKYKVGEIITEGGFISTSHTKFWNHASYTGETTRLFIKSKTGHILKELSEHSKEREVLFNMGTSFKVISAKMNQTDRFCSTCFDVILEEIED